MPRSRRFRDPRFYDPRFHGGGEAQRYRRHRHGRGGRRAARGDVRAAILALLAEEPMHGYEMIKEIEERTGGVWNPSAGSIYPTLQMLEDQGLVRGTESEGRRSFELTDAGREEAEGRSGPPPWEEVRTGAGDETRRLGEAIKQLHHTFPQVFRAADDDQRRRVVELLDETRRKIYAILSESE
jgi:DNA-binding PadR family transcriptional regulator